MKATHLEFKNATSNKFWSIELKGKSHTVSFGRSGTKGQSKKKAFDSAELAEKSFNKLIRQKLAKSYLERVNETSADRQKLDLAFRALRKRGFIALHDAGYTLSDAFEDLKSAFSKHPDPDSVFGFCVYHRQDVEGAIGGHGLNLGFTTARAEDEEKMGVEVGKIIKKELEKVGLNVDWNGSLTERICLPEFDWTGGRTKKKSTKKKTAKKKTAKKKTAKRKKKK